ncbi:MAG: DUF917 domain-containing protein [Conexivisphaerales archaeon]
MSSVKKITKNNVELLALGSAVLGSGGGGNPYVGSLIFKTTLLAKHLDHVEILPFDEVDERDYLICSAGMGSPVIGVEKIPNGMEYAYSFKILESFLGRKNCLISPIEIGGINSIVPLITSAYLKRNVVDADGEGRAFPELQMTTFNAFDIPGTPMVVSDERGNNSTILSTDNRWAEKIARAITVSYGGRGYIALYPMTGRKYRMAAIPSTLSYAYHIGESLRAGIIRKDAEDAFLKSTRGKKIFSGKITELKRINARGFAIGYIIMEGMEEYQGRTLKVFFQNEYLLAKILDEENVIASTPDIISLHNEISYLPVTTDQLRYALRCHVFRIPISEKWLIPKAKKLVDVDAFFGNSDT